MLHSILISLLVLVVVIAVSQFNFALAASSAPSSLPTSLPSSLPSSLPTSLPTTLPTVFMTHKPSETPTESPTEIPTAVPTATPTAIPTETPTLVPTAVPTTKTPTARPTRTPTATPTLVPTAAPTLKPTTVSPTLAPTDSPTLPGQTNKPTAIPTTGYPTSRPSAQPTSRPSEDVTAKWTNMENQLLAAISNSTDVMAVFSELVIKGRPYDTKINNKWSVFVGGTIPALKNIYRPKSIELYSITDMETTPNQFNNLKDVCNNETATNSLTNFNLLNRQVTCNGKSWGINSCSNAISSSPSYCVDCASNNHCNELCSTTGYNIYPSGSQCNYANNGITNIFNINYIRAVVVKFNPPLPAPNVISYSVAIVNSITVDVTVNIESDGYVYLMAYPNIGSESINPTSADVISKNIFKSTTSNTAVVRLTNLNPATSYKIAAVTISSKSIQQTDTAYLAQFTTPITGSTFTTSGSRSLNVNVNFKQLKINTQLQNAIRVTIPILPVGKERLTVTLNLGTDSTITPDTSSLFFPSSCVFTSTSVSTSCIVNFIGYSDATTKTILTSLTFKNINNITVTAPYTITYPLDNSVVFSISAATPNPPILQSAIFSNDGSYVIASFDTPTNKADITTSRFSCDTILNSNGATFRNCYWLDSSTVKIIGSNINIGYSVQFKTNTIRAACVIDEGIPACDTFAYSTSITSAVIAPTTPVVPDVQFVNPTEIGSCLDLRLSLTSSKGNGGRAWSSRTFAVISSNTTQSTIITNFLNTNYQFSPPTAIPQNLIIGGNQYIFVVTLCNFLGACGTGSTAVNALNNVLPSVSILGDQVRNIRRGSTLKLNSYAYTPECSGSKSTKNLQFVYQIYRGSSNAIPLQNDLLSVTSTSADPTVFQLPPYTLQAGLSYTVVLSVLNTVSYTAAATKVIINVPVSGVVSVISGGNKVTLKRSNTPSPTIISASNSYDRDTNPSTLPNNDLKFLWSCIQTTPTFSNICPFNLPTDLTTSSISVYSTIAAANSIATISVLVTSSTDLIGSTSSITVDVGSANSPIVTISNSLALQNIVLIQNQFVITAPIRIQEPVRYVWTCDSLEVDLKKALTSSNGTIQLPTGLSVFTKNNNLKLGVYKLPSLSTITFKLKVSILSNPNVFTETSVTIKTSGPPVPGTLTITPSSGSELQDTFILSTDLWTSDSLPLSYEFGFINKNNQFISLRSQSESSTASVTLPRGDETNNNLLNIRVITYDANGAYNSIDSTVTVLPMVITSAAANTLATTQLSTAGDANSIGQICATFNAYLNYIDCSTAPNCDSLHRSSCSSGSFANTCGSCLPGYSGVKGQSNVACIVDNGHSRKLVDSTPLTCVNDCSAHGTCSFVNINTGVSINSCTVSDSQCLAICTCTNGYYGTICSYDNDLENTQETRTQLLQALLDMIGMSNVDDLSVKNWISQLNSNTQQPDELNNDGILLTTQILQIIVNSLPLTTITASDASELLLSVDRVAFWYSSYTNNINPISVTSASVSSRTEIMNKYGSYITSTMIAGQDNINTILSEVRIASSVITIATGVPNAITTNVFNTPRTAVEVEDNYMVSLSSIDVMNDYSNENIIQFNDVTTRAKIYNNGNINSNPMSINVAAYPCATTSSCNISLTLQHNSPVTVTDSSLATSGTQYTTMCNNGDFSSYSYICNSQHNTTVTCNGVAGTFQTRCPHYRIISSCNTLNGNTIDTTSTCKMTQYTSSQTSCICDISNTATDATTHVMKEYVASLIEISEGYSQIFIPTTATPTAVPTSSPVDNSYLFLLSSTTKSCYNTCTIPGISSLATYSTAPTTEFCNYFTNTGCTAATVASGTCKPSCMSSDCDITFCSTFAFMAEMCSYRYGIGNQTKIIETTNQCIASFEDNFHIIEFGVEFIIPSVSFTAINNDNKAKEAIKNTVQELLPGITTVTGITVTNDARRKLEVVNHFVSSMNRGLLSGDSKITVVIHAVSDGTDPSTQANSFTTQFASSITNNVFSSVLINNQQHLGTTTIPLSSIFSVSSSSVIVSANIPISVISTPSPTSMPTSSVIPDFAKEGVGSTTGTMIVLIILAILVVCGIVYGILRAQMEKKRKADLAKFAATEKPFITTTDIQTNPAVDLSDEIVLTPNLNNTKNVSLIRVEDHSTLLGDN